jgi:hypothetical protein
MMARKTRELRKVPEHLQMDQTKVLRMAQRLQRAERYCGDCMTLCWTLNCVR